MKDLTTYINEGIFDEEENLNDLDWYSVTLETLKNAKTEEEFNKYFDILEMCVKKSSSWQSDSPVPGLHPLGTGVRCFGR